MNQQQKQVEEFMRAGEQRTPSGFIFMDEETVHLRAKLILEEALETVEAMGMPVYESSSGTSPEVNHWVTDLPPNEEKYVEVIDGLCDLLYVVYGAFSAMGLDAEPFFNEVHMSNMSKFDGPMRKNADGKVLKPESYFKPDLGKILRTVRDRGKSYFTE